jgi:peroxiredoxin
MSRSVSYVAVLLLLLAAPTASASSPLFQNLDSDAFETIDNHSEQGKWLVVMIWAHDCEICEREVGSYQQFHDRHQQVDARVLGITIDGSSKKKAALGFVNRHQLEFANLLGEPETVTAYYQLLTGSRWIGTPSFLIFAPGGELKAAQAGGVPVEVVENFIASNISSP